MVLLLAFPPAHDNRRRLIVRTIPSVHPTSLHSTLSMLLYRLELVILTIHTIPLLPSIAAFGHSSHLLWLVVLVIISDSYYTFLSYSPPMYFALHYLSVSPPCILISASNEINNGLSWRLLIIILY